MPLSINTNIASLSAQRSFLNSSQGLDTAYERLASGKRINSARDDAAGLGVATNLESRVSGLNQAVRNTNDGISMVQIAEGAMAEVLVFIPGLSCDARAIWYQLVALSGDMPVMVAAPVAGESVEEMAAALLPSLP